MQWNTRDNIFTPNKGLFTALLTGFYSPSLGGQAEYGKVNYRLYAFHNKLIKKVVTGFKFHIAYKTEDAPFWELPSVVWH